MTMPMRAQTAAMVMAAMGLSRLEVSISKEADPSNLGRQANWADCYFLSDLRRARRWLRREVIANTLLESPAKTKVGFSGVSSQPP